MELVELTEALEDAYMEFLEECLAAGDSHKQGDYDRARTDFAGLLRRQRNNAEGLDLPQGWVPQKKFLLVGGGRVLGSISVRYWLTEALKDFGGHIGYTVRPSERGKGCATEMLRLMLDKARRWGLARVLLTCNKDNPASARVIQKNGGRLESESFSKRAGRIMQRYWVQL